MCRLLQGYHEGRGSLSHSIAKETSPPSPVYKEGPARMGLACVLEGQAGLSEIFRNLGYLSQVSMLTGHQAERP